MNRSFADIRVANVLGLSDVLGPELGHSSLNPGRVIDLHRLTGVSYLVYRLSFEPLFSLYADDMASSAGVHIVLLDFH
jgi:hypothetical protein